MQALRGAVLFGESSLLGFKDPSGGPPGSRTHRTNGAIYSSANAKEIP